jgi:hypothetical protein
MEIPWDSLKRILLGSLQTAGLMILGILAFTTSIYLHETNISPRQLVGNLMTEHVLRTASIIGETDNITISIAKFCNTFPVVEQAECVVRQTEYNYKEHDGLKTPDEFYKDGGVCRDIAIYYASIFKNMGWNIYYNLNTPEHVFIEITKNYDNKNIRCTIDGIEYNCAEY